MNDERFHYKTEGICATEVSFEVIDGKIRNVTFTKGCKLRSDAIADLVDGMTVEAAIRRFQGGRCDDRKTSCGDQLAIAINEYLKKKVGD